MAFAATIDDRVVGTACLRRAHPLLFQITFLCVDDQHRGLHLGSNLLKRLVSHTRQYRSPQVAVYADHDAVGFFEKHGFDASRTASVSPDILFWLDQYNDATILVANVNSPEHNPGRPGVGAKKKKGLSLSTYPKAPRGRPRSKPATDA